MANNLKNCMNEHTTFKQKPEAVTPAEKEKIKQLSAGIETSTNKKLVVRCFLVAALIICLLQSRQIASFVDGFSPNFFSDSVKVVSREWHRGMQIIGIADVKDQLSDEVKNIFPELKTGNDSTPVAVTDKSGKTLSLRGTTKIAPELEDQIHAEREPRALTRFGRQKFRGSL